MKSSVIPDTSNIWQQTVGKIASSLQFSIRRPFAIAVTDVSATVKSSIAGNIQAKISPMSHNWNWQVHIAMHETVIKLNS